MPCNYRPSLLQTLLLLMCVFLLHRAQAQCVSSAPTGSTPENPCCPGYIYGVFIVTGGPTPNNARLTHEETGEITFLSVSWNGSGYEYFGTRAPGTYLIEAMAAGEPCAAFSVTIPFFGAGDEIDVALGTVDLATEICGTGYVTVGFDMPDAQCLTPPTARLDHDGGFVAGVLIAPDTFAFSGVPPSEQLTAWVSAGCIGTPVEVPVQEVPCPPLGGAPNTIPYNLIAGLGAITGTPPPLACGPIAVSVVSIPGNEGTEVEWDGSGASWTAYVNAPGSYRVTLSLAGCTEEHVVDVESATEPCSWSVTVEGTISQVAFGVPDGSAEFSIDYSDPDGTDPWSVILTDGETGATFSGSAGDSEEHITINGLGGGDYNVTYVFGDCSGSAGEVVIGCVEPRTIYRDSDGDGYGWAATSIQACNLQEGYVDNALDCDDDNFAIQSGTNYRMDRDGDGAYVGGDVLVCGDPAEGLVPWQQAPNPGDCNDNDPNVSSSIGSLCDDGNPCTTDDRIVGGCACVGTPAVDSDNDGICDAEDDCDDASGEVGSACDDGPGTPTAGVLDDDCNCVSQTTDCLGVTGGTALPGTDCDDGNPLSIGETWSANCQCGERYDCLGVLDGVNRPGTLCNDNNPLTVIDTWQDDCTCVGAPVDCLGALQGTALPGTPCTLAGATDATWNASCQCVGTPLLPDCNGVPGGPALPNTPCSDGDDATVGDTWSADCACIGQLLDTDEDGIPDGIDGCPTLPGEPGSTCDDLDPGTINDVLDGDCACAGIACTTAVQMQVNADGNGAEISWSIRDLTIDQVVCSANGVPDYAETMTGCCLIADRCYKVVVTDAAGDGIVGGGYHLSLVGTGQRIIDDRDNFRNLGTSAVSTPESFCLPLGDIGLEAASCDRENWVTNEFLFCEASAAVSDAFVPGAPQAQQPDDTGYEFWFFDPNGTYSYRRFVSHRTAEGRPSAGALRVNALRVNGWTAAVAPLLPARKLLNVRVRPRVAGENQSFGPACRFRRGVPPACSTAQLLDAPGEPGHSCNVQRRFWKKSRLYATPTSSVLSSWNVRYMFRFHHPASGQVVTRVQKSSKLTLYWEDDPPLIVGRTYNVDVRISYTGGATWCGSTGLLPFTAWGPVCTVTILPEPSGLAPEPERAIGQPAEMVIYPNPNNGNEVMLSLVHLHSDVANASVIILDLSGRQVFARNLVVQDGGIHQRVDLGGALSAGVYLVHVSVGEAVFTQRMVVRP
ncbi:MAG TPA: T9SS type A sorting domain-containing protein [Flavobacteriales bacterium]|nr:T9SS type A sorting domain-containing protein [Flavobacteriales bacterium]